MRRQICLGFSFFCLTVVPVASGSQAVSSVATTAQLAAASSNPLDRKIDIDLRAVALSRAIDELSSRAGIRATYVQDVVSSRPAVSLTARGITAYDAFVKVLRGTGLELRSVNGQWAVVEHRGPVQNAAQGVITGKVTDAKTGRGIAGANILVASISVNSGEDGSYRVVGVPVGTHTVSVRLVGYAKQTRTITLVEGATAVADFKLEAGANVLDQVVVTGTIAQTELKAVPTAITVITAKQIEERGITRIDQLFRGDVPGLFSSNVGGNLNYVLDDVVMFSRGATSIQTNISSSVPSTTPIKTYVDGVELADSKYLSQIDPKSIERIEILTGPQASTVYGSNAINGIMQVFTKRGSSKAPQLAATFISGLIQSDYSSSLTPQHDYSMQLSGIEGRTNYNVGGSWNYTGAWTPANKLSRTSGFGGIRMQLAQFVLNTTIRSGETKNWERGDGGEAYSLRYTMGISPPISSVGRRAPTTHKLNGRTFGATAEYTPRSWFANELVAGTDVANNSRMYTARRYSQTTDSLYSIGQGQNYKSSFRSTATLQIPVLEFAKATLIIGGDEWRRTLTTISASSDVTTGTLTGTTTISRTLDHNAGAFVQTQLGVKDALFLTYGLRAEWNPNYGEEAQPNVAPRYGVAYTRELGMVTAKLRASYGRSTRPPTEDAKREVFTNNSSYGGLYISRLAAPELGPEFQQGGEGGLEFYMGNRMSIIVTRYNQTVDNLILAPVVDSVSPTPAVLITSPTASWAQVTQNMNIGSIRNQGWELQSSVNTGPFTTRGTYSWNKSRILGITPKYRPLLRGSQYQPGFPFSYAPEHTLALGMTYSNATSVLSLNVNGVGMIYASRGYLYMTVENIRLNESKPRMNRPVQRESASSYYMADLNFSHRFSAKAEGLLQISNLGNFYQNDVDPGNSVIGRQTKAGLRLKL